MNRLALQQGAEQFFECLWPHLACFLLAVDKEGRRGSDTEFLRRAVMHLVDLVPQVIEAYSTIVTGASFAPTATSGSASPAISASDATPAPCARAGAAGSPSTAKQPAIVRPAAAAISNIPRWLLKAAWPNLGERM